MNAIKDTFSTWDDSGSFLICGSVLMGLLLDVIFKVSLISFFYLPEEILEFNTFTWSDYWCRLLEMLISA